jgi:hypothetical protein
MRRRVPRIGAFIAEEESAMVRTLLVGASAALAAIGAQAQLRGPVTLNDTGALLCVAPDGTTTPRCARTGQDGAVGRDARDPADGNGHGGFKFVKLDGSGHRLAADAPQWRCVADAVTGLVWEVKTTNGGVDGAGWRYTNYGEAGDPQDTGSLVAAVNAKHLCGSSRWRLPTIDELQGIVDYGVAGTSMVDARFFPNVREINYWASTPYADDPDATWGFNFSSTISGDGAGQRSFHLGAMLVHDAGDTAAADPAGRYVVADDEVADTWTGLTWRRCSAGQTWDGAQCAGSPVGADWAAALRYAADESARTGLAWRLPNQKELASICDRTRNYPAIDPDVFPNVPSIAYYWTSTPYANDPTQAFTIDIRGGYTQPMPMTGESLDLRLVRESP